MYLWIKRPLEFIQHPATYLLVEVSQLEVEEATGQTSEAEVGAEAGGAGQQGVGIHARSLKVGHPRLRGERATSGHTLARLSQQDLWRFLEVYRAAFIK